MHCLVAADWILKNVCVNERAQCCATRKDRDAYYCAEVTRHAVVVISSRPPG